MSGRKFESRGSGGWLSAEGWGIMYLSDGTVWDVVADVFVEDDVDATR